MRRRADRVDVGTMHRGGRISGGVLIACALLSTVLLSASCGRKAEKPASHAQFKELNAAFQPLRRDFEAESGKVRLVAVVAPTCSDCNASVQEVQSMLVPRVHSDDLVVYVVWNSVLPTDVTSRVSQAADMFAGPGIRQYWDDSGRCCRGFARLFDLDPGRSVYNMFFLYGRNDTWDPEAAMNDESPNLNLLTTEWKPGRPRYIMGEHKGVTAPRFDVRILEDEVRKLLAEPAGTPGS